MSSRRQLTAAALAVLAGMRGLGACSTRVERQADPVTAVDGGTCQPPTCEGCGTCRERCQCALADLQLCETSCGSVASAAANSATGGAVTLATAQFNASAIAVDDSSVYWTTWTNDGFTVMRLPLRGGTPTPLTTGQGTPRAIAVDAENVYWTDDASGTVSSVPIGGGDLNTIAAQQARPGGVAVASSRVFWTNAGDGTVMTTSLPFAPEPRMLARGISPSSIAVDPMSGTVYWTDGGDGSVSNAGSPPLFTGPGASGGAGWIAPPTQVNPRSAAAGPGSVCWAADDGAWCAVQDLGAAMRSNRALGATDVVAIALDEPYVYWVSASGAVARAPVRGGATGLVAQSSAGGMAIAVGATDVYWTTADGDVMSAPK